jgi:hypothetical protein
VSPVICGSVSRLRLCLTEAFSGGSFECPLRAFYSLSVDLGRTNGVVRTERFWGGFVGEGEPPSKLGLTLLGPFAMGTAIMLQAGLMRGHGDFWLSNRDIDRPFGSLSYRSP